MGLADRQRHFYIPSLGKGRRLQYSTRPPEFHGTESVSSVYSDPLPRADLFSTCFSSDGVREMAGALAH